MNMFNNINDNGIKSIERQYFGAKDEALLASKKASILGLAWRMATEFNRQCAALNEVSHTDELTGEVTYPYAGDEFSMQFQAADAVIEKFFDKKNMNPSYQREKNSAIDILIFGKSGGEHRNWTIDVTLAEAEDEYTFIERFIVAALLALQFEDGNEYLPRFWRQTLEYMGLIVEGDLEHDMAFTLKLPPKEAE